MLKFESDLICALCHHGKMIADSHSPVNTVMTEHPGQLLHMDTVGPSRVRSMKDKWYVLIIVTTTLVTLGFTKMTRSSPCYAVIIQCSALIDGPSSFGQPRPVC
jgi:hypothetical protein